MQTIWDFRIGRFLVVAQIEPCQDCDLSWDETGETQANLSNGLWEAFDTRVQVYFNGAVIGENWLCGSIYENPADFFSDHRGKDPMNRNCSLMRASKGDNVVICHYFPDMVSEAIKEARAWLDAAQIGKAA
jgi:hypothetical protein